MLYPRTYTTLTEVEAKIIPASNQSRFTWINYIALMHIGVCTIWLTIPDSHSLKQKRQVVKSITDRLKNRFNIAVAEVDGLDRHQQAVLGVVSVSNDTKHLNRVLSYVINFVEDALLAELTDYEIEILS